MEAANGRSMTALKIFSMTLTYFKVMGHSGEYGNTAKLVGKMSKSVMRRVAEVAREHGWHPSKSLDSDENFKPEHTLFCRELRFVAIYALFLEIFGHKKCLFG